MTDKITQKEIIDLGLWSSKEVGDPTTDRHAAAILLSRLQIRSLVTGARFIVTGSAGVAGVTKGEMRSITIAYPGYDYPALAFGENYCEAVCQAVRTLPDFLVRYPECAAKIEQVSVK
jgi:hypothetical protein